MGHWFDAARARRGLILCASWALWAGFWLAGTLGLCIALALLRRDAGEISEARRRGLGLAHELAEWERRKRELRARKGYRRA